MASLRSENKREKQPGMVSGFSIRAALSLSTAANDFIFMLSRSRKGLPFHG